MSKVKTSDRPKAKRKPRARKNKSGSFALLDYWQARKWHALCVAIMFAVMYLAG